jgi:nucleolar GTP-binding protein
MNYNFKSLPSVPTAKELIDIVLSKTQRKTPTEIHPQMQITRIRKFYMRKVKFTQSTIEEKLGGILEKFPKLDDIHPFYADLMNVLYDKDHYKLALGHVNKANHIIENVAKDYVRMLKYSDSLYRGKTLKKAALGRMCTIIKKLGNSLTYLEEVRKHLSRLPNIDPNSRTIIITGYPNVGKSSFMNNVTRANVDVQSYEFTTKSLFVGHTDYDFMPWQVIDTPGLLDRPLEQRNTIEMQAITALAHLNACILFFIDISETCDHKITEQIQLFRSIQPLFLNKPLGIVLSKTDIKKWEAVSEEDQQSIQALASEFSAFVAQVSNTNKDGIIDCRNLACEHLKSFRGKMKVGKGKQSYERNMPYVSVPRGMNSERPAVIPESVLAQAHLDVNPASVNVKEAQEMNGGAGVYFIPHQEHFVDLEEEDWRYDVMPEVFEGKNVQDYIDSDILDKLNELELEEEVLKDAHIPIDYDELREIYEIRRKIFLRRRRIQQESMVKKGHFQPDHKDWSEVKEGLESIGIDPTPIRDSIRQKRRREPTEEFTSNIDMDIDQDHGIETIKKKIRSKSQVLNKARRPGTIKDNPDRDTLKQMGKVADKIYFDTKPKHLNTGKSGIGKRDYR